MSRHVSLALLLLAGWLIVGGACRSGPDPEEVVPRFEGRDLALPLAFESWRQDLLHCEEELCAHWYRIELDEPSSLRIDVEAASGPGVPDFDVRLEDAAGEIVWGFAPTGFTPRRIERMLGAGSYYLLVHAVGEERGPLRYEVVARRSASDPVLRLHERAGSVDARRAPVPASTRPEAWFVAEILQVEGQGGRPERVSIDAGAGDDLRVGLRGELLNGDEVIAEIELVEVDSDRSRARIDRAPRQPITYETRARVRVPLP